MTTKVRLSAVSRSAEFSLTKSASLYWDAVLRFKGYEIQEAAVSNVLVTGGSGFVGSHVILQLLAAGHQVRTTVRNLQREGDVRAMLKNGGADASGLSFFAADLESDAGMVRSCRMRLRSARRVSHPDARLRA